MIHAISDEKCGFYDGSGEATQVNDTPCIYVADHVCDLCQMAFCSAHQFDHDQNCLMTFDLPAGHRWIDKGRSGKDDLWGSYECKDCGQTLGVEFSLWDQAEVWADVEGCAGFQVKVSDALLSITRHDDMMRSLFGGE